ncbi:MAG: ABC transporter permease [Chitinophagaceae bacterium]|nr:ABC transporter permease [Chitinophagaceae bacterium]
MNKTWLIIKREYITRVRNRTFLLSTFLTPLLFAGLITAVTYISAKNKPADDVTTEVVVKKNKSPKKPHSDVAYGVGYGGGFLIYITLFIYGSMVMRGVMEEKTNRIAEVIVSSVKPFQLMIGKIVGIGAVGLTQFFMWLILIIIFGAVINAFIPPDILAKAGGMGNGMPGNNQQAREAMMNLAHVKNDFASVNWWLVIPSFVFYFLFGYLFYASIFAAVGSTVNEDPQDAQSLMFPITMPIILSIVIMFNSISNPDGALATWSSMIPFFSPVVMMARIPFGVPWWQIAISMLLLVGGFLFTTWLGAKIYRTGILLYGKKVTWREIGKWLVRA